MRVIATLTVGNIETKIEGDSVVFEPDPDIKEFDYLEEENIGFWLKNWFDRRTVDARPSRKSRVFVPWSSCLYVETIGG